MSNVITQAEADAAARTGVDEVIHGAGVEGILAVHEFRKQVHIALLRALQSDQVRQPLPGDKILGADDAGGRDRGGQIRVGRILAFRAEDTVDPAIFMPGQAHVINVGLFRAGIRQKDGSIPEAEPVHGRIALGHAKEALAVVAFNAGNQIILAIQFDGAGIKHGVDAQTLHEIRIVL